MFGKETAAVFFGEHAIEAPLIIGQGADIENIHHQQVAGFGAFLGHLFPVWLRFKGGKGVATYIGLLIGLAWPAALIFCAIWLVAAFATRYSSLAALIASALTPLALWLLGQPSAAALFLALTVLLWIMHRANISRLLAGSEDKIGAKATTQS